MSKFNLWKILWYKHWDMTRYIPNKTLEMQVNRENLGRIIEAFVCGHNGFSFIVDFLNIFRIQFDWTKRCDHAGIKFKIVFLLHSFRIQLADNRHWDFNTNDWCVYDNTMHDHPSDVTDRDWI